MSIILADDQKDDQVRLVQVIQELEQELMLVTELRDYYVKTWVPQAIPWNYEMILNEYRFKIIKHIFYFKDLLQQLERAE